jgi:hypothetical protein
MALHLVVFAAFADGAQLPVTPLIRSDRLRAGGGSADIRLASCLRGPWLTRSRLAQSRL